MNQFYYGSEHGRRSERLDCKFSESIISANGRCYCGKCNKIVLMNERPTTCRNKECGAAWKQIILMHTGNVIERAHLPTIGIDVVSKPREDIDSNTKHELGMRSIRTVTVTDEFL